MTFSKENVAVLVKTIRQKLFYCASNNIYLTYSHHVLSKSWRYCEGQHIGMQKLEFLIESCVPLGVSVF